MLGSDWRKLAKTLGIGLAIVVGVLAIYFAGYWMGSALGYFDAQADGYSAQYPSDTDQRVERCFRDAQSSRDTQNCVSEAVQSSHENQRTEQDLSAQRQSANWAWWIFVATLAQMPLTIAGLIFLAKTILQGQEAHRHAQNTSDAELRPWVKIEAAITACVISPEKVYFGYDITLTNIGKTVAAGICIQSAADLSANGAQFADEKFGLWDYDATQAAISLLPGETCLALNSGVFERDSIPWMADVADSVLNVLAVSAIYKSRMDDRLHRTERSFVFGLASHMSGDRQYLAREDVERGCQNEEWATSPFRSGATT